MKVGDYVRYKKLIYHNQGVDDIRISKIKDIEDAIETGYNQKFIFFENGNGEYEDRIIKSSPNIIDLFEEHDLVVIEYYSLRYNERVTRLFEVTFKDGEYINLSNAKCEFMLVNGEFNKGDKELKPIIKSIVTHEQLSQMEYKVDE